MLIHERSGSSSVGAVDGGVRFVVAYEVVRAYAIISHHGHSLARHPKSLSQKGKSSGIQVSIVSEIRLLAGVRLSSALVREKIGTGGILAILGKSALSEIHLRLKDDGSIVRELVLQTHSETMSSRIGITATLRVIEQVRVVEISGLRRILLHILICVVIQVVAAQVHLVVQEGGCTIKSAHKRGGDTVTASPASLATTHSATANRTHHITGDVAKAAVVSVISIQDEANWVLSVNLPAKAAVWYR